MKLDKLLEDVYKRQEMKNILQYVAREQRTILAGHGVLLTR